MIKKIRCYFKNKIIWRKILFVKFFEKLNLYFRFIDYLIFKWILKIFKTFSLKNLN
jgi:hypothetical protein